MKFIFVLTCLCFLGVTKVFDTGLTRHCRLEMEYGCRTSRKVLDFISYFNGNYDNKAQTQKPGDDHAFIQTRFIPVEIKCLQADPVVFIEEVVNNTIQLLVVFVVTDGIEDTVSLTIYDFTNYTNYKPREFKVETLYNISCGDLQGDRDCIASFRVASEGFSYGNFPYCSVTVNGEHPRFTGIFNCHSVTTTVPMFSHQTSPMEPYEFRRTGQKYPLINPPKGYDAPCGS